MKKISLCACVLALCLAAPAVAEPLGVGVARNGGPFSLMAIAIGKALQAHGDIEFRPRSHRGSSQYVPLVDSGELELGIANALELGFAFNGTGIYEGRAHPNLRLIGATYPFRVAFTVSEELGLREIGDIRGLKIPGTFSSAPIANVLIDAMLANGGLSQKDVTVVPVTSFGQMFDDFAVGKFDAMLSVLGSGGDSRMEERVGKLRALGAVDSESALAATREYIPMATIQKVLPSEGLTGVVEPIDVIFYDVLLFANKDLPENTAYEIAKTMTVHRAELIESNPNFALLSESELAPQFGLPYHPGAERFYRDHGTWQTP